LSRHERPWLKYGRESPDPWPGGPAGPVMAFVWLIFILVPIVNAVTRTGQTALGHWLAIAGACAFSATYVCLVLIMFEQREQVQRALCVVLVVLAVALTTLDNTSWAYLFAYCGACVAMTLPSTPGFGAVLGCAGLAVGATALGGGSVGAGLGFAASTIGVGFLLMLLRDLRVRNSQLSSARAELAQVAVTAERARFARDLHDLLGHSLSVIAIKAELAGRLLPDSPSQAAVEVSELEAVARQALGEVREAVSGYRQPTLEEELAGARVALSAAGIDVSFSGPGSVGLDPSIEAVLAWTVREGATNVIRHSGASRCAVRVSAGDGFQDASVEVIDDGAGNGGDPTNGNGLAGLRERARAVRGRLEAGSIADGGFKLVVSVPVNPR
jgi:two-component system, NarL family, sensor histidine kinase DesK